MSIDCEYASREYQVVLRPDILMNSFRTGVMQVVDELTTIEKAATIPFKISKSSLKFKNVSTARYIADGNRGLDDFYIPLKFKSRQKKVSGSADIVTKISDSDPALACVSLAIVEEYINKTKVKFELDVHGENGRIRSKSGQSYATELSSEFDQTSAINLSAIFIDAASRATYSGRPLIIVPDGSGKITMQTAEFNINIAGEKLEASIIYSHRGSKSKSEFSFKVKGAAPSREILTLSQELVSQLSRIPTIALFASLQPTDE